MFKLPHNCTISHSSKVMLKIIQAQLQQYVNWELPDVQAGFRKGRGARDNIANTHWIRKTSTSASLTMLKPLIVWITTNCGKFLERWEYQNTLSVSWETYMQVKKKQLELGVEHELVQNWERSTSSSNTLATWCKEPIHEKGLWCWERLRIGEGGDRGCDGWMTSPIQWTWVWTNSRRWWRRGKPGVLQSMGMQRLGYDWVTEQ